MEPRPFKQRQRYVARSVRRELTDASRGRCCVCRSLVIAKEAYFSSISGVLERHHIIFFSRGGSNRTENLVLLCPLCHAIVHAKPSIFTTEYLRATKAHWLGMREVVPSVLTYSTSDGVRGNAAGAGTEPKTARFAVDSLGLQYVIRDIPGDTTVDSFVTFALQNILDRVDRYDNHDFLKYLQDFMLTHRMNKSEIFEGTMMLASCRIADDDAYTIKGKVQGMRDLLAIPMGPLIRGIKIRVSPESPASGETYLVEVADGDADRATHSVVFVSVRSTDGYSVLYSAQVDRGATARINVRAAKAGTVDTIEACVINDYVDYPTRKSVEVIFRVGGRPKGGGDRNCISKK